MKLSELKKLVAILEANDEGRDAEVLFTDYSTRAFPVLDFDRKVSEYVYADHVVPVNGRPVHIHLDLKR